MQIRLKIIFYYFKNYSIISCQIDHAESKYKYKKFKKNFKASKHVKNAHYAENIFFKIIL